jgi:hypothetical protein
VDVDFIPRSFGFYLHIDPCTFEMTVGIERFRRNISLTNYHWGMSLICDTDFTQAGIKN